MKIIDELKGILEDVDYESPIVKYRADKLVKTFRKTYKENINPCITLDVFYTLYLPFPVMKEDAEDEELSLNRTVVSKLKSLKDYEKLKYDAMVDLDVSFSYTITFLKKLIDILKGKREEAKNLRKYSEMRTLNNLISQLSSKKPKQKQIPSSNLSGFEKELEKELLEEAIEKAHSKAKEVAENIKNLKSIASGSGAGKCPGLFVSGDFLVESLKLAELAHVKDILKNVKQVFSKTFTMIHRERYDHKHGVYDGICLGRDLVRILPRELTFDDTIFYKKFVDGELLLRKRILLEEAGPLYVLLDKCLVGETEVTLKNGDVERLRNIKENTEVLSVNFNIEKKEYKPGCIIEIEPEISYAKVKRTVYNGIRRIYEVRTEHGSFYATGNHRIPVFNNGIIHEKTVSELTKKDYMIRANADRRLTLELSKIIEVSYCGREEVWDLILEKHHYFLANNHVVHNSGSMAGEKTVLARALALALFKHSRIENREFYLRFFDYIPHELIRVRRREKPTQIQKLFIMILTIISNGGTWIAKAISTACKDILRNKTRNLSTIILITDGIDAVHEKTVKKALKEANAELITIMIKGQNETLRNVSKKYYVATITSNALTIKEQ